jgi:hypothetical protein
LKLEVLFLVRIVSHFKKSNAVVATGPTDFTLS